MRLLNCVNLLYNFDIAIGITWIYLALCGVELSSLF